VFKKESAQPGRGNGGRSGRGSRGNDAREVKASS
jgi:hypothetical protein